MTRKLPLTAHPAWTGSIRARGNTWLVVALAVMMTAGASAAAPQDSDKPSDSRAKRRSLEVTEEWRKAFFTWALSHPPITERARGHRLAGIRLTLDEISDASNGSTSIATIVLFDHTAGEARQIEIDVSTGDVLADRTLSGRPQRSREELNDAIKIIRGDDELARLLRQGAVVDGGFIVSDDDPDDGRHGLARASSAAPHRLIQLKLLSRDRFTLLRSIVVDLTAGVIASSGTGP